MKKTKVSKLFGEFVCDDKTLKKYTKRKVYNDYLKTKELGETLSPATAKAIASAIKNWALSMGATHYTHWFMPLNGKTAEKQVSFVEINSKGEMIEELSEKALIKGEADASSFPNGGERNTFEARGYTIWDYTSPVFIKEDFNSNRVLYIPTAFCSYNGMALDEKTPLLRATQALNRECLRVLKILGYGDVKKINFYTGIEQEYFLIKRENYKARLDLNILNRTLLGTKTLKSQEIGSHYFGSIDSKVSEFMNEVDRRLWKMGVTAKHQHNEVAPCQYEFVPIYSPTNIACDQNQLIMETISKVAKKHGLKAIFEEKPFAGINGSGKHANWSIATDTGINLFDADGEDKDLFFTFFISMISAIDKFNSLIRVSASSRNNDLRLGGDEAPPAVVSVFASDYLLDLYEKHTAKTSSKEKTILLDTGVTSLPMPVRDFCDRNRTSPFTFGGNRFEFRMIGSNQSVTFPSTAVCVALSNILKEMADGVDKTETNKKEKLLSLVRKNFDTHKKIVFNGNGYDEEWLKEAERRGIPAFKDSLEAFSSLDNKTIIDAFEEAKVLSKAELAMRKSVMVEKYLETVILEAKTMVEMFNKTIFYNLENLVHSLKTTGAWKDLLKTISSAKDKLADEISNLSKLVSKSKTEADIESLVRNKILPTMKVIRTTYDEIEGVIPDRFMSFPNYNQILY